MVFAFLLLAGTAVAPSTSVWRVEGKPGAVIKLTGVLKSGDKLIADGMITDENYQEGERAGLTKSLFRSHTCAWAADVRPFTRLRRFAKNGRLLWEWHVDRLRQALRLHSGDGDCLSPDGGRMTIAVYRFAEDEPINELGRGVIAVDHGPRFVDAIGARTHLPFDSPRSSYLTGWQRGKPATLLFDVASETKFDKAGNPEVISDSADLSRAR